MNFRKLGMFFSLVTLLALAYAAYGYYQLSWGWRWEEVNAIGAGIKGDVDTLMAYREKAREMRVDAKRAVVIGGMLLTLGTGLLFSSVQEMDEGSKAQRRE
jgi:hypothetical protein